MRNDKMPTGWRLVFYLFCFACICFTVVITILRIQHGRLHFGEGETKPYTLKQNGDTLFIPTQVVVKHDTLVVIRTEERRPIEDSIANNWVMASGFGLPLGGYYHPYKKEYKQRDTIYEHKIIYY